MNSLNNNNMDIEANFNILTDNEFSTKNNDIHKSTETSSNNDNIGLYCLKSLLIFLVLFVGLPLCFCDLYYAYTDDSCVSSHVDRINVNLKQYLQVSGLLTGCFMFIVILIISSFNENSKRFLLVLGTILFIFIGIFNTAWNVIGGIIFWGYMDNSLCSDSVFNYVLASLIIKYVCTVTCSFSNNKKKD